MIRLMNLIYQYCVGPSDTGLGSLKQGFGFEFCC